MMPVSSMTGFARIEGQTEGCTWAWELKSVNGKGRDLRCRIPGGVEHLEQIVRERAGKKIQRGNVFLNLSINSDQPNTDYKVNYDQLESFLNILPDLTEKIPALSPPSFDGLLGLKGIIEISKEEISDEMQKTIDLDVLYGLDAALDAMVDSRNEEGAKLSLILNRQLNEMASLCDQAEELAAIQPSVLKSRLHKQVSELLEASVPLPEEQLAKEVALLVAKADVREELDRLAAHVGSAQKLLGSGEAIGRRLDFLCQEFNREVNTLCSKSTDLELTRTGLDLKALIDQFREQVQNIE
jgi:uncharacterized protein (TIGR00255 family)